MHLRLCLFLASVLTLTSCRHDYLPEKETYSNSSAFQLTSKRISLSEAKHKSKLATELDNAETKLKKLGTTNVQGRVINYSNGVSINTDHVTYIENGPNFHTYTFSLTRENSLSDDDPIENLVLVPTTEGTYREMLISYNLTAQEKEMLLKGEHVDTKDKVTVTLLDGISYNPLNAKSNQSCVWVEVIVGYTACSLNAHFNGEGSRQCDAPIKSQPIRDFFLKCTSIDEAPIGNDWWAGPGGGSSSGGGGGEPCTECPTYIPPQPCEGNGVATQPVDPNHNTNIGVGGECEGIPTVIELPNTTENPCAKIKAQRADPEFSGRIIDLQGKTGLTMETGYIQKWGGSYDYKDNASATDDANTLSLPLVATNKYIKAFIHTHVDDKPNSNKKGIKMFSPADVVYFMDLIQNAQTQGHSLSDPYAVMVTSTGNYQLRFTGNKYQIKTFTEQEEVNHREPFVRAMEKFMDTSKKREFRFLKYIQEKMLLYGITLYRMNSDGTTTEIKLNADKTDIVENNCPN